MKIFKWGFFGKANSKYSSIHRSFILLNKALFLWWLFIIISEYHDDSLGAL
jgi:hypothetical protein